MIAIGFGVALTGYAAFMLGYCWLRDYNVTLADLFKATWPGAAGAHTGSTAAGTGTTQKPGTTTAGGRG